MARWFPAVLGLMILGPAPAAAILPDEGGEGLHPAVAACHEGRVWHGLSQACVDPESGLVGDDTLFAALQSLSRAGRHSEALRLVRAMAEQGTPRVLTAEGYLLRRTGQVEAGLALYHRALAMDPDYHLARSYLGLWHVGQGDLAAARAQLAEIALRGGRGSQAWHALAEAIGQGRAGY